MANDELKVNMDRDILKVTPRKLYLAVLALNGAYCLELDNLFAGATAFADPYRKMDYFSMDQPAEFHLVGPCAAKVHLSGLTRKRDGNLTFRLDPATLPHRS